MSGFKEITISHGLPDGNSGGSALGVSFARVLKNRYPDARVNYITYHKDPKFIEIGYPYMIEHCPYVHLLPTILTGKIEFQGIKNSVLRKARNALWAFSLFTSLFYLIFPSLLRNEAAERIRKSDVLCTRGTNIFYDKKGARLRSTTAIYWMLFPLLYAWRVDTPFVVFAQSFGPFHNDLSKKMVGFVFRKAQLVMPREKFSEQTALKDLKIPAEKVVLVPDSVFSMEPKEDAEIDEAAAKYDLKKGKFLAVTIRVGMRGETDHAERIAEIVDEAIDNGLFEQCVIVNQCYRFEGYHAFETDSAISRTLLEMMRHKDKTVLLDKPLAPDEMLEIYGAAKITLGMRLHSVILSMVAGTPSLAFAYWGPKTPGIMNMAGLDDYFFNIAEFTPEEVLSKLEAMCSDYEAERQKVAKSFADLHARALHSPQIIEDRLKARKAS